MVMYIVVDVDGKILEYSTEPIENGVEVDINPEEIYTGFDFDQYYKNGKISNVENIVYTKVKQKQGKDKQLAKATVTTASGNTYNAGETSQNRMLRSLYVANLTGQVTVQWKLANNSTVTITIEELTEALKLSVQNTSDIILNQ